MKYSQSRKKMSNLYTLICKEYGKEVNQVTGKLVQSKKYLIYIVSLHSTHITPRLSPEKRHEVY